jgi:hypothetical protein
MSESIPTQGKEGFKVLGPHGPEERLSDALDQLPTPGMVRVLIESLKPTELRELAEGVLNDCTQATRRGDLLENAESINSWIATAEETINTRRKYRSIKAAREEYELRKSKVR